MKKISRLEADMPALMPKKRVAAYARVSVESERMHHSLSAQVSYYSDLIQGHSDWQYAGVYADDGITGTSAEKRDNFKRMLDDCESGKIDIILTKSVSRFARNTVDLLNTVRHLRDIGVEVRFEKEGISTFDSNGELMLTLLASFAQSESESISQNVKWAVRKKYEKGIPNGHYRVYGYEWQGDELVIVPEEAEVVKRIYQNFLDGKSRFETEREFAAEGITTRKGGRWIDSNIKFVLCNNIYTGDLYLQKQFVSDPISKKLKPNRGELPQYYIEDHHEAIIDKETFNYVQEEMARRRELGRYSNKSSNICCFTSKIICPYCGKNYNRERAIRKYRSYDIWTCSGRKRKGGHSCPVGGSISHKSLVKACREVLGVNEFDEQAFLEKVDHIEVPERHKLDFFLKDGNRVQKDAPNTGLKDCWTAERRAAAAERRRQYVADSKSELCFSSKIRCAVCGGNYYKHSYRTAAGNISVRYSCRTTRACGNSGIHEDTLKELAAEVMGLDEFGEEQFKEQIDYISIAPGGHISFIFYGGHRVDRSYDIRARIRKSAEDERG